MSEEEKKELATLKAENETLKAAEARRAALAAVEEALASEAHKDLPAAARKRVIAAFEAGAEPEKFDVAAAVKSEREYLATVAAESADGKDGKPVDTGAAADGDAAAKTRLKQMAESVFDDGSGTGEAEPAGGPAAAAAPNSEEGK